ncbi:glycosyltransferase family 2 protein [Candidatus Microgenomates bacterium]|nr:glycosyltransferase family 2 protein [Candidatus Microgenomates bacterium]
MAKDKISVIIFTKNEEKSLPYLLKNLKNFPGEILVIDGQSTDKTREIAQKFKAKVFSDPGWGKGGGIKVAIKKAASEVLVFMDGDGSHDPADIKNLVKPILADKADHVIGSRILGGSDESHGTFYRFIRETGSHIVTILINYRFKTDLSDSQNGFRAIKRDLAKKFNIKEDGFAVEQEILIKSLKHGLRVVEVPAHEYTRRFGKSRISLRKVWLRHLYTLFKYLYF